MKSKMLLLVLAIFTVNAAVAQEAPEAKVTPLLSKELKESQGREGLMLAVEYPPGGSDPIHRHNAHGIRIVLS